MACKSFTPEEMHQAWQQARRHTWPATFDEAMNDPIYFRLIRAKASCIERARHRAARQAPRRQLPVTPVTPPVLDFKRLAAGERDDD